MGRGWRLARVHAAILALEQFTEYWVDVGCGNDLLLGEAVGEGRRDLLVLVPQRLVLARGDLHVGEVLHDAA